MLSSGEYGDKYRCACELVQRETGGIERMETEPFTQIQRVSFRAVNGGMGYAVCLAGCMLRETRINGLCSGKHAHSCATGVG